MLDPFFHLYYSNPTQRCTMQLFIHVAYNFNSSVQRAKLTYVTDVMCTVQL